MKPCEDAQSIPCRPELYGKRLAEAHANITGGDDLEAGLRTQPLWNFGTAVFHLERWREAQITQRYEGWVRANHELRLVSEDTVVYGLGLPVLALLHGVACHPDKAIMERCVISAGSWTAESAHISARCFACAGQACMRFDLEFPPLLSHIRTHLLR